MEKRVVFRNRLLPYLLVAPQIIITISVFHLASVPGIIPVGPAGGCLRAVIHLRWFDKFARTLLQFYLSQLIPRDAQSSVFQWPSIALSWRCFSPSWPIGLRSCYHLQDVYHLALCCGPSVAGVLWFFLFNPTIGMVAFFLKSSRGRMEPYIQRFPGHDLRRHRGGLARDFLQLSVFPGGTSGHPTFLHRSGGHRRRRTVAALLDHRVPAAVADGLLPDRGQHRLCLFRHLRRDPRHHPRRAQLRHEHPGVQGVQRRISSTSTSAGRPPSR